MNPFLINTPEKKILFDVGIGEFGEDTGVHSIRENLEVHELHDYDITDIFLSHLHYDHIGGLAIENMAFGSLLFPKQRSGCLKQIGKKLLQKINITMRRKLNSLLFWMLKLI